MESGRSYRRNQTYLMKTKEWNYDNIRESADDDNEDFDLSNSIKLKNNLQESTEMRTSDDNTVEVVANNSRNVVETRSWCVWYISGMSTKMYKNPCYFVNIYNNSWWWGIYVRVLNGLRPIYKESYSNDNNSHNNKNDKLILLMITVAIAIVNNLNNKRKSIRRFSSWNKLLSCN